ncbi:MAG TPA: ribosome silencing factor [Crinalium sp.]|jgi:ribosome-associated protein
MTNISTNRTASALIPSDATNSNGTIANDSYTLAMTMAEAADDRKGADIVLLDVSEVSYLADYFVIATGFSSVQVRAIARSIQDSVSEELHRLPLQVEGQTDGNWILIDYGDVIAHIFMPEGREFYNLEAFWGHAKRIPFALAQH